MTSNTNMGADLARETAARIGEAVRSFDGGEVAADAAGFAAYFAESLAIVGGAVAFVLVPVIVLAALIGWREIRAGHEPQLGMAAAGAAMLVFLFGVAAFMVAGLVL